MSLKLAENNNKRKGKEKNRVKLLLNIAIFLFLIWAMTTIWMAMTYKHNDKTNGENEGINRFINKEEPTHNVSIENSEEDKTFENMDRDEFMLPMETVLKDKTLRLKNIEEIFGAMKSPKEISTIHSTFGKEVFYIYHSHSRESFLPYLKEASQPDEAYHSVANITLVGKMLERAMDQRGIGTKVDTTDIVQLIASKNLDYTSSYDISRELVQQSQNENKNLEYFIDIHRDSLRKENTTTEINRAKYANILFVVGTGHAEFESNLQFANNLHKLLENRYPTLSKGVLQKSSIQGNGVYNQDLSPNSIIIEIGGVDNTVEELHRTTEALAEVFSDYYWENNFESR